MHSYLRAVGFSKLKNRSEIRELIRDVVKNYDEKTAVEEHPDGVFVEFSKYYGCDCGVTVCGQYDEDNRFHVDYYFPFFRGTGVTTQEQVTVEKHLDKESYAGACDDLRIGITLIFYLQNAAEYLVEHYKGNLNHQPLTLSGLASEGRILFPALKDKEAVKVDKEITKNRSHLIAAARNGDGRGDGKSYHGGYGHLFHADAQSRHRGYLHHCGFLFYALRHSVRSVQRHGGNP